MKNRLLIISLVLTFATFLFFGIAFKIGNPLFLLLSILSPITGMIIGIYVRSKGRQSIGRLGAIMSLLAIILPVIFVLFSILVLAPIAIISSM